MEFFSQLCKFTRMKSRESKFSGDHLREPDCCRISGYVLSSLATVTDILIPTTIGLAHDIAKLNVYSNLNRKVQGIRFRCHGNGPKVHPPPVATPSSRGDEGEIPWVTEVDSIPHVFCFHNPAYLVDRIEVLNQL